MAREIEQGVSVGTVQSPAFVATRPTMPVSLSDYKVN